MEIITEIICWNKPYSLEEKRLPCIEHPILGDQAEKFGESYDFTIQLNFNELNNFVYLKMHSGRYLLATPDKNIEAGTLILYI